MKKVTNSNNDNQAREGTLALDQAGLDAARQNVQQGAMTPAYGPWGTEVVKLLNGALATESTCVLRYRRHHFTADGVASPKIAEEFMVRANAELGHADRIAERIAVESYRQMIALIGDKDSTTRRMLEDIRADEEEHAEELKDWLEK